MQQMTFTSPFLYNETSKSFYRGFDRALPQYIGSPSPEIDQNWHEMLSVGQYLVLNETEAKVMPGISDINGQYLAEVDAMHSLHCLNYIRKELDAEYYRSHDHYTYMSADGRDPHIDHCIEHLRQTIQCGIDLTPVPLVSFGTPGDIQVIGQPQVHTCRNWDVFRAWWTERGALYGSLNATS